MGGNSFLLMSRVDGRMACDEEYMKNPAVQAKMLAAGLKMLWNTDISYCPADWSPKHKLAQAAVQVKNGLVDMVDDYFDKAA